ncbi:unnamed protein product [Linum trigynum]|uniref:Uncharacterized protein n=1 Tax=Linum trigynum TaxID=586398 RepID=A0AAV2GDF7_9ROSI
MARRTNSPTPPPLIQGKILAAVRTKPKPVEAAEVPPDADFEIVMIPNYNSPPLSPTLRLPSWYVLAEKAAAEAKERSREGKQQQGVKKEEVN